jgi:hypothetical protein
MCDAGRSALNLRNARDVCCHRILSELREEAEGTRPPDGKKGRLSAVQRQFPRFATAG